MIKIMIAEDDASIAKLIAMSLGKNGYICKIAPDGTSAAELIENESFDLALLDVMLPGLSGFELLPYIKEYGVPVIFITAKSAVDDRVRGLKGGADDYIVKPFDISELLARVEAVLRRYDKTSRYIAIGDVVADTVSRTVTKRGEPVELTLKEFDMLLYFAQNRGIALYRETIYEKVWNEQYMGNTRTVDLHVQRLRKKLELQNEIQSVYKVGYRLEDKR